MKDFGFDLLNGIEIDDGYTTANFSHIYRTTYASNYREHMCFQWGSWCWLQAREHPMEAVKYLLKRRLPR